MPYPLINVTDPRGKKIICTRDCWHGHVLRRHSFMQKFLKFVEKTLEKPDAIHSDRKEPDAQVYYKRRSKYQLMRVVVKFDRNQGEVKTVFKCNSPKRGEVQIWP